MEAEPYQWHTGAGRNWLEPVGTSDTANNPR
jgi:hypothetical protein